jgi:hypothetical protein
MFRTVTTLHGTALAISAFLHLLMIISRIMSYDDCGRFGAIAETSLHSCKLERFIQRRTDFTMRSNLRSGPSEHYPCTENKLYLKR